VRRSPAYRQSGLALVPALLPVIFFLAVVLSPPLNQDVAAVLSFAERMVAGEQLYAHLIDVNPPLIFLLNLPAVWLAAWTPLSAVQALLLLLLLFCAGVVLLCLRLRLSRAGPAEGVMLLALLPLALLLAGYDFGQREQLMAAAAMPIAGSLLSVSRASRSNGLRRGPSRSIGCVSCHSWSFQERRYTGAVER
jgi:hypothetical protein